MQDLTAASLRPLPRKFYEPTADVVAVELLGQLLVRQTADGPCGGAIVETEAYIKGDAAAHSFKGGTSGNRVMFGPPGFGYVYFIYGSHWCFNTVCRPEGAAEAVLIRAVEPLFGLEWMGVQRPVKKPVELTNGPGKLCEAMGITGEQNGVDLCDVKSPVFVARNAELKKFLRERGPLVTTTRIGIVKAAALPLRFYLGGSGFVSKK